MVGAFLLGVVAVRGVVAGAAWYCNAKRRNAHLARLKEIGLIDTDSAYAKTYEFYGKGDVVARLVHEYNNQREELGKWLDDPQREPFVMALAAVVHGRS